MIMGDLPSSVTFHAANDVIFMRCARKTFFPFWGTDRLHGGLAWEFLWSYSGIYMNLF